ncbi:MAG TPA: ATP-binding protein, partial [Actinomycetota bacterium]|nr:ATP-binding protein [Actinomycetota bacterium]
MDEQTELGELGGAVVARREAADWEKFASAFASIADNVMQVIQGKEQEVRLALVCLVAEGHLLIEDVPGVGKTMLAKSIARSIDCS